MLRTLLVAFALAVFTLLAHATGGVRLAAQAVPDAPHWAYGYMKPPAAGESAPPCPPVAPPFPDCAYPVTPVADDGVKRTLPGTGRSFTRNESYFDYGPADWYPEDHPAMPDVVAKGKQADGVRACALCHYPNGQGKMENGGVAGLPAAYIQQQLADFKSGARRSADPRKANTNEMAQIAKRLTDEEAKAAAEYFASMSWRKWVRVVESDQAPRVRATTNGLFLPVAGAPQEPPDSASSRCPSTLNRLSSFAIRARDSWPTCPSARSRRARCSSRREEMEEPPVARSATAPISRARPRCPALPAVPPATSSGSCTTCSRAPVRRRR